MEARGRGTKMAAVKEMKGARECESRRCDHEYIKEGKCMQPMEEYKLMKTINKEYKHNADNA